jgi:hypothetical protein
MNWRRFSLLAESVLLIFLPLAASCGRNEQLSTDTSSASSRPVTPRSDTPLPDSAFRVEWGKVEGPSVVRPGKEFTVRVPFKNVSGQTWPDAKSVGNGHGTYAVRLSSRWFKADSSSGPYSNWYGRVELPQPLAPGNAITLPLSVIAPTEPGNYKLQIDLVQELVAWFGGKQAEKLLIPIAVE